MPFRREISNFVSAMEKFRAILTIYNRVQILVFRAEKSTTIRFYLQVMPRKLINFVIHFKFDFMLLSS